MFFLKPVLEKNLYTKFPSFIHPFFENIFVQKKHLYKKVRNLLLNNLEMKMGRQYLISYPYYLYIDPTNICNLKCPLCPTWQYVKERPKGKMSMETFRNILDETGPYLFALSLFNWGEPLFNPHLPAMINYAKQYNIVVGISTNLHYLPDTTARELIESGVDIIIISLDGASQENYEKYRRGGNLSTVLGNIERLNSYRQDNKKFPFLIWQFLVNRYNEAEIDMAREIARKMGLYFYPMHMRTSMGKELLMPLYERVKEIKDWLPENPAHSKYSNNISPGMKTRKTTCTWLWNAAIINWDGSVSPCCGVFEKIWDFETCYDAQKDKQLTFHQVWNSPRYRLARSLVSAYMKKSKNLSIISKEAVSQELICSKCIKYGFLED